MHFISTDASSILQVNSPGIYCIYHATKLHGNWSVGAMVARGPPKAKVVGSSPISVALFLFAFGAPAGAWCHEFGTGL